MIAKLAANPDLVRRECRHFPNARGAFKAVLRETARGGKVLLPSYIGYSAREGSGVFDPIEELALPYSFYTVNEKLEIDLDFLASALQRECPTVFVIVHYFGYTDPFYVEAVSMARRAGALIIEDEAHSMLTDLCGGCSGRLGDYSIFSVHKMLPVAIGGILLGAPGRPGALNRILSQTEPLSFWEFDLQSISKKRRENAQVLERLLTPLCEHVRPLWTELRDLQVPQTYPVVIRSASRDKLYHQMNTAGFGVVSLYHTLIPQVSTLEFPCSHQLSRTILNLPIHQETGPEQLEAMVACLGSFLDCSSGRMVRAGAPTRLVRERLHD